ncbi:MAG: hypothetical protein JXR76_21550 [Deltaproteobacteria bacterium]|nr:hypothetical protein [Deltaproteobacteria bacterium]
MKNDNGTGKETTAVAKRILKSIIFVLLCLVGVACTEDLGGDVGKKAKPGGAPAELTTSSAAIVCSSYNCESTPDPLPDYASASASYSPWGSSMLDCYYAGADYFFEKYYDFFSFGNKRVTGRGVSGTHWCGSLPMSLTTDYSVNSDGLYSLWFDGSTHTINTPAPDEQCAGADNGWEGCRGTGCHACIELLDEYPKYFVNHPHCVPNLTCQGEFYTCSTNCPAPTAADK